MEYQTKVMKDGEMEGIIKVKSEKAYDVMWKYEKFQKQIDVHWDILLSTFGSNGEDLKSCKCLIQKICQIEGHESDNVRVLSLKDFLFECIINKNIENVQCIVESTTSLLNAQNTQGRTPILYAAEIGREDIVEMLAKQKPDISIIPNDGKGLTDYIPALKNSSSILDILNKVSPIFRILK